MSEMAVRSTATRASSKTASPQHDAVSVRATRARAMSAPSMLSLRGPAIQPQLRVNRPNDPFEREADGVADRVMRVAAPAAATDMRESATSPNVQRMAEMGGEEQGSCVKCAQNPRHIQRMPTDAEESVQRSEAAESTQRAVQEDNEAIQRATNNEEVQRTSDDESVQRSPTAEAIQRAASSDEALVQRRGIGVPTVSPTTTATIRNPGAGQPLSSAVRSRVEPHVGANLSPVRVHTNAAASQAATSLQARAFTHGNNIFLRRTESSSNLRLMAHETTHVVQQGAAPIQRTEADEQAQRMPEPAPAATPDVQRGWLDDLAGAAGAVWDATGGALVDAAGNLIDMGVDFFWSALERMAPSFVPILRQIQREGILGYLGGIIRDTFSSIFDTLSADPGLIGTLTTTFLTILATVQTILGALASGDCQPLFDAIGQLKDAVAQMVGDAWNAITEFFRPVGEFFSDLWQKFGAPVIDWLTAVAGDVWQWIQDLGAQIWSWTQPIRDSIGAAWNWVKEQLFGSEDEASGNSEGGLIGWITDKASQAWDAIKAELEPVIEPIRGFAESVMAILPLDAIINLRDTVQGWLSDVQNMSQAMGQPDDVADNQTSLRDEILPAILSSIMGLRGSLLGAGQWVASIVGTISASVTNFLSGLRGNSLLSPLTGAISWIQETVTAVAQWGQETVVGLFTSVGDGLVYLSQFIEPVLDMLQQLISLVSDLMGVLPNFISGIWQRIPACIREPIQNFVVDKILSQIPIFAQLLQIPDIWTRVSQTVMTILRQVFVNGDLAGAAWTFFRSLLTLVGIPPELVLNIISKAATAISDIIGDPVGFFINMLRAVKQGFINFFGNVGTHLLNGVTGWLFSELEQANIRPPQDLSLRSIIGFVLEVLGVTVDNFFERLGNRIGRERAQRIRRIINTITGALSWIVRLVNEGPGALWEEIQGQLSNLWNMVLQAVIGWVNRTIVEQAIVKVLSFLDPTGIMAVVNSILAIYRAIQSFARYVRQMLEVVNTALDGIGGIARGAIDQAAGFLEGALARIMPIAIGFLANQVGLRGLGRRIGEMVETVRGYVNQGIDWLINVSVSAFEALVSAGRRAVGAVLAWWRKRRQVGEGTETHTLYFRGEEDAAQLYIESTPGQLSSFINQIKINDRYKAAPKQAAINDVEGKITELQQLQQERRQAKSANQTSVVAQKDSAIDGVFTVIVNKLNIIFADDDNYGTRENAIPLDWPGPPSAKYPKLYFGGRLPKASPPKSQSSLKELYDSNTPDETGTQVQEYEPEKPKSLPGGREIGLTEKFHLSTGTIVGPLTTETTGGGGKLGRRIKPYGFSGALEDMDLDHVHEIQFGGRKQNDQVGNLWPLDASLNRSKGSTLSQAAVKYPQGVDTVIPVLKLIRTPDVQNRRKFFFKVE